MTFCRLRLAEKDGFAIVLSGLVVFISVVGLFALISYCRYRWRQLGRVIVTAFNQIIATRLTSTLIVKQHSVFDIRRKKNLRLERN